MTNSYIPQSDIRRHFLVTGTYVAEESISSAAIHRAVEKALISHFADPVKILSYGTPKYHHPYAMDVRQQILKLTPEEFEQLNDQFPYLMTALMTFFKGAFVDEATMPTVVVDAHGLPSSAPGV